MKNRLELYKAALVDYEKGHEVAEENETDEGFCLYFKNNHELNTYGKMKIELPELYKQRKIEGVYHYSHYGDSFQGNADRVTALRNVIKELEDERN